MKNIQYLLAKYLKENGITIAYLARASGIKYELLRRSLNGRRILSADELIMILVSTNIKLADVLKQNAGG